MSHHVHPKIFRIRELSDWKSQWFDKKNYKKNLEQDYRIRTFLTERLKEASVDEIIIKRSANSLHVIIKSGRPGIIIGRGGTGVQDLKKELISKIFKGKVKGLEIKIDIEEIRKANIQASIVAKGVAEQIERRMPFRRVLKQTIQKIMQDPEALGAKVSVAGRLNGTEMARTEWLKEGKLPLQTIRANIDYAQKDAFTTYGVIGVKVWIYKGEVF